MSRELKDTPRCMIGGHNLNKIRCANDTVLTEDSEKKTAKTLRQSRKKGRIIN